MFHHPFITLPTHPIYNITHSSHLLHHPLIPLIASPFIPSPTHPIYHTPHSSHGLRYAYIASPTHPIHCITTHPIHCITHSSYLSHSPLIPLITRSSSSAVRYALIPLIMPPIYQTPHSPNGLCYPLITHSSQLLYHHPFVQLCSALHCVRQHSTHSLHYPLIPRIVLRIYCITHSTNSPLIQPIDYVTRSSSSAVRCTVSASTTTTHSS